MNPANQNPARNTKARKDFPKKLDFKDIKVPLKTRNTHKIRKKNSIGIRVFGCENKEKIQSIYQNNAVKKNMLIYY